jgi:tetratricopeptide (TPR) repeat protein
VRRKRTPFGISVVLVFVFSFLATAASRASADADPDEAAELEARKLYALGEYQRALDIYASLYAETMHPTYLRNIGRCQQNLGKADRAIASFREYLRKAKGLPADQRAEIEGYIAEMEDLRRPKAPPPAPSAAPATAAPQALVTSPPPAREAAPPLYERGWFWVAVGVVAAGVALGIVLASQSGDPSHGNLGVLDLSDKKP